MRIDTTCGKSAAQLLAEIREQDLADMLYQNAGERYSRRIAKALVTQRRRSAIMTAGALAALVWDAAPPDARHGRSHPATKTFQALRIAVNGELEKLPALLEAAFESLADGGRLGVISFHSLEDRIVKLFFREKKQAGLAALLTPKPVAAGDEELRGNPPSRSAKLRVIEKEAHRLPFIHKLPHL
jgi:16S rRNA (cytosine1402-N4)-methyltransferase